MSEPIVLALPWPPSVNRYWRRVGNRTLISRHGRAFKALASQAVLIGRRRGDLPRGTLAGRLSCHVEAYPPDRRKRDLDNVWKPLLDSLETAGLIDDDEQFDQLSITRCETAADGEGMVLITLERLE